jgi:formylglycine-generating enzyme required for sulfatase activity
LTPSTLEKQVKKINDSLSAAIYETSNQLYNMFLNETKNNADSVHISNWSTYTRYVYFQNYHLNPLYRLYPVVNITYEAALHFCEWLTIRYNQSDKRKYKEVLFRLPTEAEWELAAHAVTDSFEYPWTGPYLCNSKGCFMANFNPLEEEYLYKDSMGNTTYNYPQGIYEKRKGVDGAVYTAPINAYYPNKLGLYNCAGNAAEMITEKGICKGGSWTSNQYNIQINSRETYNSSNANLGFRYFMQIKQK